MSSGEGLLQQIDNQIDQLFSGWNIYTTLLSVIVLAYLVSPLFFAQDPDIHPFLLARQSYASHVRQPGESATYRSLEAPHGYPLRTGLNVKDEGAPKWASGRDGDLRDVWKQALRGVVGADGKSTSERGRIISVMGKEEVIEHDLVDLTRQINSTGDYLREHGGKRVAIYLPNSVELLVAFFAVIFYGLTPIMIPQGQSFEILVELLLETKADVLIAHAGTLSPKELFDSIPGLNKIVWVVGRTSRHMDWVADAGNKDNVAIWHDIIEQRKDTASAAPFTDKSTNELGNIVTIWSNERPRAYEVVEFTQKNVVAAIAAQGSALPRLHRFQTSDLLLPLDSLSLLYPMTITMAAIFSNASVALSSVAGPAIDFSLPFQRVSPTVVVASSETMSKFLHDRDAVPIGTLEKIRQVFDARTLSTGRMPKVKSSTAYKGLRVIYVSDRIGHQTTPLNPEELFQLRILTGARFVYSLTAAKVAGAIAQTNMLDYRRDHVSRKKPHFGPPLSCVEIKLLESSSHQISNDAEPVGNILVTGPAVVDGEVKLEVLGRIRDDNTLSFV